MLLLLLCATGLLLLEISPSNEAAALGRAGRCAFSAAMMAVAPSPRVVAAASVTMVEAIDIHHAVARNDEEQIKKYVFSGQDLDRRDKDSLTPLHVAAAGGFRAIVEFLVKHQAG